MVCRVLADVLDTEIVNHKGEADFFGGMLPKGSGLSDGGLAKLGKDTADHLIQALKKLYTISIDWTGSLYCSISINWDYYKHICDISVPTYIREAFHKFQHPAPSRPPRRPSCLEPTCLWRCLPIC